jgi:hypothetical protein
MYAAQLQDKSDGDVRQIVTSARNIASRLGIEAGRDVTTLAEVLVLDPAFGARTHIEARPIGDRPAAVTKLRDYLAQKARQ